MAILRTVRLRSRARALPVWPLAAIAWAFACADERRLQGPDGAPSQRDPSPVPAAPSPAIVSDPALSVALAEGRFAVVLATAGRDSLSLASESATFTRVAFISLPSGTVPTGLTATMLNRRTGMSAVAEMVAGGFDPVGVEAQQGDSIELEVRRSGAATPLRFVHKVPAKKRPKVVRTNPPPGKRDVALNSRIGIIFSEPMDDRTLVATPIRLFRGTTSIPGEVVFEDGDHVIAAFVPNEPLTSGTDYRLVVNQDVHDLDGDALEEEAAADFATVVVAPVLARLVFTQDPEATIVGQPIVPAVRVSAEDATGNVIPSFDGAITIALSSNPTGASLLGATTVVAMNGIATFSNLVIDKPGSGYRLGAETIGLATAAMSAPFDVTPSGDVVYSNAFDDAVGPEWSFSRTGSVPSDFVGSGYLGDFGCPDYAETTPRQADNCPAADLVRLTLTDLPEHVELTITFDFYAWSSWDGNPGLWEGDEGIAPDVFDVSVEGGPTLLHASFAAHPDRDYQSFPAPYPTDGSPPVNNPRGTGSLGGDWEAVYRLTFTFPHSAPQVTFKFTAPSLQWLDDEWWGLDNVAVRAKSASP